MLPLLHVPKNARYMLQVAQYAILYTSTRIRRCLRPPPLAPAPSVGSERRILTSPCLASPRLLASSSLRAGLAPPSPQSVQARVVLGALIGVHPDARCTFTFGIWSVRAEAEYLIALRVAEAAACARGLRPPAPGDSNPPFEAAVEGDALLRACRARLLAAVGVAPDASPADAMRLVHAARPWRREELLATLRRGVASTTPADASALRQGALCGCPQAAPFGRTALAQLFTAGSPFVAASGASFWFVGSVLHVRERAGAQPFALPVQPCGLPPSTTHAVHAPSGPAAVEAAMAAALGRLGQVLFVTGSTQKPCVSMRRDFDPTTYPPELFGRAQLLCVDAHLPAWHRTRARIPPALLAAAAAAAARLAAVEKTRSRSRLSPAPSPAALLLAAPARSRRRTPLWRSRRRSMRRACAARRASTSTPSQPRAGERARAIAPANRALRRPLTDLLSPPILSQLLSLSPHSSLSPPPAPLSLSLLSHSLELSPRRRWTDGVDGSIYLMPIVPEVTSLHLAHELRLFLSGDALGDDEGGGRGVGLGKRALGLDAYALRRDAQ